MPDSVLGNTSTTATIAIGTSVAGTIDTLGDHDWYRVTLVAGHTYEFALDSTLILGGSALDDPTLSLRNASGTLVAVNDDSLPGSVLNSLLTYTASTSGTFFLDAGAFGDEKTGDFRLTAFDVDAPVSLDAIADYLTQGYWGWVGGLPHPFATSTITYNLQGLTVAEQSLARLALQTWDDVGSFSLVETSGAAQISFDDSGHGIAQTGANGLTATVHISTDWNFGDMSINSYMYQTYVHEIGHALGLGHSGPYNGSAIYGIDNAYSNDSLISSVMSYFWPSEAGTGTDATVMGPQLADIIAIGNLYGLSTTTRLGDTVYGFHSTAGQIYDFGDAIYGGIAPAFTIFDNGGTDTLDASGYGQDQRIDLNAETWSDIGGMINNIAIARGTVIENAVGGAGSDTITGNAIANVLTGGDGGDHIYGNGGDDTIFAGAGHDFVYGGDGNDTLVGNADIFAQESDTLDGGDGNDTFLAEFTDIISGGAGTDFLYAVNSFDWSINLGATSIEWMSAGFGNDTIDASTQVVGVTVYGGGGNDIITGSGFADALWAGVGDDTLIGGDGDDMLFGDLGADQLYGGDGNDTIFIDSTDIHFDGGSGTDALYITSGLGMIIDLAETHFEWADDVAGGNDVFLDSFSVVAVTVYAGDGNDAITGGDGDDFLWGQAGNDTITGGAGDDVLVGGSGSDVLIGGAGTDTILANSGAGGDGAADTIVFNAPGWGTDFVYDFEHGLDKFNMNGTGATAATITIDNVAGNAHVHFGSDLIVVVGLGGILDTSDFQF